MKEKELQEAREFFWNQKKKEFETLKNHYSVYKKLFQENNIDFNINEK
jgi:hypothetical protein